MAKLIPTAVLSAFILFATVADGQEVEQPQQAGTGIVITAASDGTAIRVVNSAPLNGAYFLPMMIGGNLGASSNWLHDPQVQKELGLLAEQMDKIKELKTSAAKRQTEMFKAMREVTPEKRGEFLSEMQQVLRDDLEKQITNVLLPHQAQRLDEVAMQMHMSRSGSRALQSKKMAQLLGLSEKQQRELRKKQAEVQKRLADQIAKLRKEAQQELIGVLTPKQQKKLETLLGKKFDHKPNGPSTFPAGLRGLPAAGIPRTVIRKSK